MLLQLNTHGQEDLLLEFYQPVLRSVPLRGLLLSAVQCARIPLRCD